MINRSLALLAATGLQVSKALIKVAIAIQESPSAYLPWCLTQAFQELALRSGLHRPQFRAKMSLWSLLCHPPNVVVSLVGRHLLQKL